PSRPVMHEFVLSARRQKSQGARGLDIAKGLIDRGFHPPTVYFPLIVEEALMVEPTETESLETLDSFAEAMLEIAAQAETDPHPLHQAPVTAPVGRLDEARAARNLIARWHPQSDPARTPPAPPAGPPTPPPPCPPPPRPTRALRKSRPPSRPRVRPARSRGRPLVAQ